MSKKRDRPSLDTAVLDICRREVGQLSNRKFAIRLAASEDIVLRLGLLRKLDRHRGCVNTVGFNESGDILVSGSDDRKVILWDWEMGSVKLSYHSGHINNIFQAKIMPGTDDRSIVTCAADGQVRHAMIPEHGEVESKLLGKHQRRVHKLANEPGSPHIFYTCGEDGLVQHFDLRTGVGTKLFTCISMSGRSYSIPVNLNSIAIDPRNPNLFVIGGSDGFTRLYDIRRYKWDGSNDFGQPADYFCPKHIIGDNLGITGLAYSDQSELLVSYCDEFIYLFSKDMGLGNDVNLILDNYSCSSDSETETDGKCGPRVYHGHTNSRTVKGVNFFGPKCEYVVSGSDCGRMFIWRKSDSKLMRVLEADKQVVNCIESHPYTAMLASSGIEHDIKIWTPSEVDKATPPTDIYKVIDPRTYPFLPNDFDDDSEDSYIDSEDEDEDYQDEDDDDEYYDDDDDDDDDDDGVGDEEVDGDLVMEVDAEVVTEVDDFTCDTHDDPNENDIQVFDRASNDEYGDSLEDFPDDEE